MKLIIIPILLFFIYCSYRTIISNIAIIQYAQHVTGVYKGDSPQWAEIQNMKMSAFEINILVKLGLLK